MAGKGGGKSLTGSGGNGPLPNMPKSRGAAPGGQSGYPVGGKGQSLTSVPGSGD